MLIVLLKRMDILEWETTGLAMEPYIDFASWHKLQPLVGNRLQYNHLSTCHKFLCKVQW